MAPAAVRVTQMSKAAAAAEVTYVSPGAVSVTHVSSNAVGVTYVPESPRCLQMQWQ